LAFRTGQKTGDEVKTKAQLYAGILSLVCLLAYTLMHTGATLATYVDPPFVGFVCAFGVELSIVSLSLRIGELRKTKQNATFFYFVLVAVVVISALSNVNEGYLTAYGKSLTLSNLSQLDIVQTIVGLSATALISLVTLSLSEIVGVDVNETVKLSDKANRIATKNDDKSSFVVENVTPLDKANDAKQDKVTERRQAVLSLLGQNMTEDDIAESLGVSVRTIQRDILSLNGQAKVTA
jgi:Trp operon repressor